MSGRFSYSRGAGGFDRTFGLPMRQFIPSLLRMAQIAPGQHVLDIATGTGHAAEGALDAVGAAGHVLATDNAPAMLEQARQRLSGYQNAEVQRADAEALTFPEETFDTVLCSMALMIFKDRAGALAGMRRVLRQGGRVAVSVNTTPEKTLAGSVRLLIAKHVPSARDGIETYFRHHYSLGKPEVLDNLFRQAGLHEIETYAETRTFAFPDFETYFAPFEDGGGPWGAEYAALPADLRKLIRDERCREMGGSRTGPVSANVEILYCAGMR